MPEGNILCLYAAPNTIKNFDRSKKCHGHLLLGKEVNFVPLRANSKKPS